MSTKPLGKYHGVFAIKYLWYSFMVLVVIMGVVWFIYNRPWYADELNCIPLQIVHDTATVPTTLENNQGCQVVDAKEKSLGEFHITTKNDDTLQLFHIHFQPQPIAQVTQAKVTITGINQYMGIHPYLLVGNADNGYMHKGVLPVCNVQHMRWRARLDITFDQRQFFSLIDFSTTKML